MSAIKYQQRAPNMVKARLAIGKSTVIRWAQTMEPRVSELVQEMDRHRERFEAFCLSLTDRELATSIPGAPWTVHGYIAHLATIEALINPWFGAMAGIRDIKPPEVPPGQPFDLDDWNEAIVGRRAGHTVEELLAEAAGRRADYVRCLSAMTSALLDSEVPFGGDRKVIDLPPVPVRLDRLLWAIGLHDPMHMQDILRALPERERDANVRKWLGSVDYSRMPEEVAARRA